jgi:hypothetical protein
MDLDQAIVVLTSLTSVRQDRLETQEGVNPAILRQSSFFLGDFNFCLNTLN